MPTPPGLRADGVKTLIVRLGRGQTNELWLSATVEGVKGSMAIDTGSGDTSLNENKYGFLLHGQNRKLPLGVPATTHVNDMVAKVAFARDFHIGQQDLGGALVALVPQKELYTGDEFDDHHRRGNFDGIMGENFLRACHAVIDCSRQLLYLSVGSIQLSTLASILPAHGWTRIPMSEVAGGFCVPCMLNGHPFRLIVDTGSPFTDLEKSFLAKTQVKSKDLVLELGLIGNAAERVGLAKIDRLQIGAYTATNVQATASADLRVLPDRLREDPALGPIVGTLGNDTLGFNGAIIDIGGQALYLKHISGNGR